MISTLRKHNFINKDKEALGFFKLRGSICVRRKTLDNSKKTANIHWQKKVYIAYKKSAVLAGCHTEGTLKLYNIWVLAQQK